MVIVDTGQGSTRKELSEFSRSLKHVIVSELLSGFGDMKKKQKQVNPARQGKLSIVVFHFHMVILHCISERLVCTAWGSPLSQR